MIFIFLTITLLSYYVYFRFSRRRLYELMCKLPGPSGFPLVGNSLELAVNFQDVIKTIESWNQKYSSPFKVWLGPIPMVAITKPKDIQIILSGVAGVNKAKMFATLFRSFLGDGLLASDETKWKPRRKLILSTFTPKILESFIPVFNRQNKILVQCLKQEIGKKHFEIWDYLSKVALDTLCETAMGINTQSQTASCSYLEASKKILRLIVVRMLHVWLHPEFIFLYLSSYGREFRICKNDMSTFTRNVIKQKMKEISERKDQFNEDLTEYGKNPMKKVFLDFILEHTKNDPDFTIEDIEDEVNTIMIAGYDTSAISNSFIFLALAMNPDVQEKCYEEQVKIFGSSMRDVNLEDLQQMTYLEMVIKESLRLYPTVYVFFRRLTKDVELDSCTIPKEATCCVAVKLVQTDPTIWKEPEKFDPDRFLPENSAARHPYSYIPFAAGPRNCIGYKYAMMSMKMLLSTVLRAYRLTTDIKEVQLDLTNTLTTTHGWMIKIEKRGLGNTVTE